MRLRLIFVVSAFFAFGAYLAALWLLPHSDAPRTFTEPGSKARVGGPFSLIDQTGKRVTQADFKGRHMLIFFGYTACPDICPMGLQTIGAALERLGARAAHIAPIFITLDPARDTPEQLADYLANFDKRLIGLTGSEQEIAAVAKAFHAYFERPDNADPAGVYHIDHASIYYLQDENGDYAGHFAYGIGPDELARRIAEFL